MLLGVALGPAGGVVDGAPVGAVAEGVADAVGGAEEGGVLGGAVVGDVLGGVVGGAVGMPPCRTTTWFPGAKATWLVHWPAGAAELASAVIVRLAPPARVPEL